MPDYVIVQQLADLLKEAGHAHHQAYIETDGADPEWPLWYAGYLQEKMSGLLNTNLTRSELTYLLVRLDKEHGQKASPAPWPDHYARRLIEWYR